jgi:uncharacterized membrane protein YeaQ/YmgE (transglycosylase-associated protein family)
VTPRRDPSGAPTEFATDHGNDGRFGVTLGPVVRRRESLSGLVTLALLAILGAFIVTRIMRRIGLGMSRSNTFGFMFFFVVVVLMVWGQTLNK